MAEGGFWAMVGLAAAIATALATGVSTAAAFWWRWHDRDEADWVFYGGVSRWYAPDRHGNETPPSATAVLANAGDGVAHRVVVTGRGCNVMVRTPRSGAQELWTGEPLVAVMPPGARLEVMVGCDPATWDDAAIEIAWTRSPTWKKRRSRRHHRVPLAEVSGRPIYEGGRVDPLSGTTTREPRPEPEGG